MATTEKVYYATGRRKTSSARVFLKPGSGKIEINYLPADKYLKSAASKMIIVQPFETVQGINKFDLKITVAGGGESGQAGAIRHGVARALVAYDNANLSPLRKAGFITRDSLMVERKKYGQAGARRRFQYSKR